MPTMFIAATYVTVLNTQLRQCSMARLLLKLLRFRPRTALPAVNWCVTTRRSARFMLRVFTVTVAVLSGLVCAQRRSAFACDGSGERIHLSRCRR